MEDPTSGEWLEYHEGGYWKPIKGSEIPEWVWDLLDDYYNGGDDDDWDDNGDDWDDDGDDWDDEDDDDWGDDDIVLPSGENVDGYEWYGWYNDEYIVI